MTRNVNLLEIYNNLLAGRALEVQFESLKQAETFRVKLHQRKKLDDDLLLMQDMIKKADIKAFSFIPNIPKKTATEQEQAEFWAEGAVNVKMVFREKFTSKTFVVRFLDEDEATDMRKTEDVREHLQDMEQSSPGAENTEYERVEYNE